FWISPMPVTLPSAADEAPALEGPAERHLVRVLQVSPDRQPGREAGHAQTHGAQHAREVRRGGLALDVRVGREDHLRDLPVREAGHELGDPQVAGPDVLDRVDGAPEHVVTPAELARALDRDDVLGLLDDADHLGRTARVRADAALLGLRDVAARLAEADARLDLGER